MQHNVNGFVRNLPDGRVEMVLEGPKDEIEEVVNELSHRLDGFIKHIDQTVQPPTGEFDQFHIRH